MNDITFKKADGSDVDAILDIYNHYIVNSTANFYLHPVSQGEFTQVVFIGHEKYQTYLAVVDGQTTGFCFLTQYKKKDAYDRTAEIGVYLKPEFTAKDLGRPAVLFLESVAIEKRIRVIVASISGENTASIKLFEKLGYQKCAHYKEVGEKFGRLLDVVDYQKILNERSSGA